MNSLSLTLGGLFVVLAICAAWQFRTSDAPLMAKIGASAFAVAAACCAPFAANSVAGRPVAITFATLPQCFNLLAFAPKDETQRVDLWINEAGTPRSYETLLTPTMKEGLVKAREALAREGHVRLCKGKAKTSPQDGPSIRSESGAADGGLAVDRSSLQSLKDR